MTNMTSTTQMGLHPLADHMHVPAQPLAGAPPEVSVVIPCYNYARYLPHAVGSVLAQEGVEVQIIVVDDASTDDSLAIAHGLARSDPRIMVIAHLANQGPVGTFNDGLAEARGEFLVRLDADDLLTPGALHRAVALALRFPSVGLVYGHPLHFSGPELPPPRTQPLGWTLWPGQRWLGDCCRTGSNVITSPEAVMRMSVVRQVGGQMPLAHSHDMEMWLRIAAFSDVGYVEGVDQAWHREHSASLSAREVDRLSDLRERKKAFETLFSGPAGNIAGAAEFEASALKALARAALVYAASEFDRQTVEGQTIEKYLAFASSCSGDLSGLPGWRSLQWRLQLGPNRSARNPVLLVQRLLRRREAELRWQKWHRSGMF